MRFEQGFVDHRRVADRAGDRLERVQQAPRVAVGVADQAQRRRVVERRRAEQGARGRSTWPVRPRRAAAASCTVARDSSAELTSNDGFSVVAPMKVNNPRLDVRQEGVLLRLVEAVHLVDEDDRRPPAARQLGALDRLADVLDAAEHRRDGEELGVEGLRDEPRERRLLPTPGGPTGSSECSRPVSKAVRSGFARAERCCWPITSSSVRGRRRSASGASAAARPEPGHASASVHCGGGRRLTRTRSAVLDTPGPAAQRTTAICSFAARPCRCRA